jgi:hypothetical protein
MEQFGGPESVKKREERKEMAREWQLLLQEQAQHNQLGDKHKIRRQVGSEDRDWSHPPPVEG